MEQSRPTMSRAKDGVLTGHWWRVLRMDAPETAGSAEDDYAAIRPAALAAATAGCPLVVAWLSRGDGADLELITMAPPPAAPGLGVGAQPPRGRRPRIARQPRGHRGAAAVPARGPGRAGPRLRRRAGT